MNQTMRHTKPFNSSTASSRPSRTVVCRAGAALDPLMLRVARGEAAERTPVWLMRQAGRYMAAFREYSEKYPFRMRSETPEIAIELSLQPYRAFRTDAVVFFSDILTPLPALGIEFDVIKGKGPLIADPVRSMERVLKLRKMTDPSESLAFTGTTLSALSKELSGTGCALIGFVGTPWTLAAYAMEGKSEKDCKETKKIMYHNPEILHAFLEHLTEAVTVYAGYQIENGAQIIQLFDSWAHHLTPEQFAEFSFPYAERVTQALKAKYPHVPVILHANGGTGKLSLMKHSKADMLGLDWAVDMKVARTTLGANVPVQGNVDPMILFGPEKAIIEATNKCLLQAGPTGHILNVGHGVVQGTPEANVNLFCDIARQSGELFKQHGMTGNKELVGV